jgi:hypothetical protein
MNCSFMVRLKDTSIIGQVNYKIFGTLGRHTKSADGHLRILTHNSFDKYGDASINKHRPIDRQGYLIIVHYIPCINQQDQLRDSLSPDSFPLNYTETESDISIQAPPCRQIWNFFGDNSTLHQL